MSEPTLRGVRPATIVRALVGLLVAMVLLAWGRAIVESRQYFTWGAEAVEADDWESGVLHLRHALQWHAPIGGHGSEAFDALVAIGDERRAADDVEGALVAYRSARFGVMAIRHVWTPFADRLPALHVKIAELMAIQSAEGGEPDPAEAARFTAQLDAWDERRPSPILGLGASVGFFAWLVALLMLASRGFTAEGRVDRRPFTRWGAASVAALVVWLICVRLA